MNLDELQALLSRLRTMGDSSNQNPAMQGVENYLGQAANQVPITQVGMQIDPGFVSQNPLGQLVMQGSLNSLQGAPGQAPGNGMAASAMNSLLKGVKSPNQLLSSPMQSLGASLAQSLLNKKPSPQMSSAMQGALSKMGVASNKS